MPEQMCLKASFLLLRQEAAAAAAAGAGTAKKYSRVNDDPVRF